MVLSPSPLSPARLPDALQIIFAAPLRQGHTRRHSLPGGAPARCLAARSSPSSASTAADWQQLDKLLAGGHEDQAIALASALREGGALRAFGAASRVPKRSYTLEELRLNKIDTSGFLSPTDETLNHVRTVLQGSFLAGLTALYFAQGADVSALLPWLVASAALLTADQVGAGGGFEALVVDAAGRLISPTYARRVALHEAGHFLVAYLLGLLPRGYTLSTWDAFAATRALGVQAGTTFCDATFQRELASGRLSSTSLDVYCSVALAGVATEWLRFGRAEGGLSDVQQLDGLLRALGFTQAKADDQVRYAVLNTVTLLRRHRYAHDELAAAMARRAPVGECIRVVEGALAGSADI